MLRIPERHSVEENTLLLRRVDKRPVRAGVRRPVDPRLAFVGVAGAHEPRAPGVEGAHGAEVEGRPCRHAIDAPSMAPVGAARVSAARPAGPDDARAGGAQTAELGVGARSRRRPLRAGDDRYDIKHGNE